MCTGFLFIPFLVQSAKDCLNRFRLMVKIIHQEGPKTYFSLSVGVNCLVVIEKVKRGQELQLVFFLSPIPA